MSCLAMLLLSFTYAFKSPRHVTFPLHKQHTASKLYSTVTDGTACTNPPRTFIESVRLAGAAVRRALVDGETLLEVEFPPLPLEYLEDSASSARDIANANTQWAVEMGKLLADFGQISLIFPDQPELDDALQYVGGETPSNPFTNVTLSTLRSDSIKNSKSIDQIIGSIFGATVGGTVAAVPGTAIYIALVSSTQELTDLEKLHLLDPSIPIIFFNLRLDFLVSGV